MEEEWKVASSFEELPVGRNLNANKNFEQEYPENYVPTELPQGEEIQPLQKRVHSKVWKTRQEAYIELLSMFERGEGLTEYEPHLIRFISDSNVQAQEKGFKILEAYLLKAPAFDTDVDALLRTVVEKGLSSNRGEIVKIANQVLVEFFGRKCEGRVIKVLEEGIAHKNPKIAAASIDAISVLLLNFGVSQLNYLKPFFKELEKLAETSAANIKASLTHFFKEAYKWLGDIIKTPLTKFKKPLQEEIQKFISTYQKEPMVPIRATAAELAQPSKAISLDAYSFAEPVDVIPKYDESWVSSILGIEKWIDKRDALDKAIKDFNTPKIVNRPYSHLTSMITRVLADSNINIQICGLQLLRCLATGLRKSFAHGAKCLYKEILYKLKEKKSQVVQEVHKVLAAFLHTLTLEDMIQKLKENLTDKAADMKTQTLVFLINNMKRKDQKAVKVLLLLAKVLMHDATVSVREKSFEFLCRVKAVFGLGILMELLQDKTIPANKVDKLKAQEEIPHEEEDSNSTVVNPPEKKVPKLTQKPSKNTQNQPVVAGRRGVANQMEIQNNSSCMNAPKLSSAINPHIRIISKDPAVREEAYTELLYNPSLVDFFVLRDKSLKETSPPILKLILSLIERAFANKEITKEALEFLVRQDWKQMYEPLVNILKNVTINPKNVCVLKDFPQLIRDLNIKEKDKQPNAADFFKEMNSLSAKWRDPITRGASLDRARQLMSEYLTIDHGVYENGNEINEMSTNLKTLITDRNPQVAAPFIQLATDLVSMCIITKTKGRLVVPAVIARIAESSLQHETENFLGVCITTQSSFLFSQLAMLLSTPHLRFNILSFMERNIQTFVSTSTATEVKGFIIPILNCLNDNEEVSRKAEFVLDHIGRHCGEHTIASVVKENKIDIPVECAKKWRAEIHQIPLFGSKLLAKNLRIQQLQGEKGWALVSPDLQQIQKLLQNLGQLNPPMSRLAIPMPVDTNTLRDIFVKQNFVLYSDLMVEWLFWRFFTERPENMMVLFEASKSIIFYNLEEIELVILLSGVLGVLRMGEQMVEAACDLGEVFKHKNMEDFLILFFVNSLKQQGAPVDEILYIIRRSFPNTLSKYLVMMAQIQEVKKNKGFNDYLKTKYDYATLKAYGFAETYHQKVKTLPSLKENEPSGQIVKWFVDNFTKLDLLKWLSELDRRLKEERTEEYASEFHTRIIESLSQHYINGDVPVERYEGYIIRFTQIIKNYVFDQTQIMRLIRTSVYLLNDLDSKPPNIKQPMIKPVNSLLISTIENTDLSLLIESLCGLLREEFNSEANSLTIQLFIKCLARVNRNPKYKENVSYYYAFLLEEVLQSIISLFNSLEDCDNLASKKIKLSLLMLCEASPEVTSQVNYATVQKYSSNALITTFMEPFLRKVSINPSPNHLQVSPNSNRRMSSIKKLPILLPLPIDLQPERIFTKTSLPEFN